jgi:transposase
MNYPYGTNPSSSSSSSSSSYGTNSPSSYGTNPSSLLARPAPQGGSSTCLITNSSEEEESGPDKNAVTLLKAIKEGRTSGKDLTIDERRLVVSSLKELGQTQDAISDILKVSRRTIVSDYKALRKQAALAIQQTDAHELAGEVYSTAKACIRRALQAGHFRTVSRVMKDMVEVLQSLGVVYRAPKTSMQAQWHGTLPGNNTGYHKYIETIGEDKNKIVEVLDCMFNAIDTNNI